jgi:hypothetical protein
MLPPVIESAPVRAVAVVSVWLAITLGAAAQNAECKLVPDDRNPPEKIMRCGDDLTVRAARGTRFNPVDRQGKEPPKELRLDAGALIIEFHPSEARKNFQILTPHAIAAVRGTKWVVDVHSRRTSTLVITGEVAVRRPDGGAAVILGPGEGVDVAAGTRAGPLMVKRWPQARVRALLARFGE